MNSAAWRSRWGPLLAALAWLLATAWIRPLALPDEGRYVGVAWEMLQGGDWLTPRLDALPYFHKPPLFYWITAASLTVFGPHEWPARLAPWLGAAAGTTALYLFARRWWGERAARLALLVLATQPLVFVAAQFANLDMLVAGCIATAIFGGAHAALLRAGDGAGDWRPALAWAYVFAALAVLAKGLIGAVLPALVIGSWLVLRGQWRVLSSLLWLPGLALFALVAAPWFVLMQLRYPDFAHYFFVVQHFARYAQAGFNNRQPFWFFPVVLALLALPWSAWLPAGRRREAQADPARRALRQLLWVWLAVVTLFFSVPQSKLVGYILPVAWPLALLVADRFAAAAPAALRAAHLWRASAIAAVAACLAAVVLGGVLPQNSFRALGLALKGKVGSGDRVVLLHEYAFDLPFYARLEQPVLVVEDWHGPAVQRDNWRKELADAGRFDQPLARTLLLTPADWVSSLCDARITWVVGGRAAAARYPVLQQAQVVATARDKALWRLPARAPAVLKAAGCGETPSANSGGRS